MRKIVNGIIFLLGACAGAGVIHFWGSNFDLGDEVNVVDLSSVLTTLFLAFYIPSVIETSRDNKRFIKETLIRRVESLQQNFEMISSKVSVCNSRQAIADDIKNDILGTFTRISNELRVIEQLFDEIKIKKSIKDYIPIINTLRRRYKNHVTGGAFDQASFTYTATAKVRESVQITEVIKNLNFLILKINSWD